MQGGQCKAANAQAAERQELEAKLASFLPPEAENCASTLQYLAHRLSQIVLISHKPMPADYSIELGPA
jgi:hypothetical protein